MNLLRVNHSGHLVGHGFARAHFSLTPACADAQQFLTNRPACNASGKTLTAFGFRLQVPRLPESLDQHPLGMRRDTGFVASQHAHQNLHRRGPDKKSVFVDPRPLRFAGEHGVVDHPGIARDGERLFGVSADEQPQGELFVLRFEFAPYALPGGVLYPVNSTFGRVFMISTVRRLTAMTLKRRL